MFTFHSLRTAVLAMSVGIANIAVGQESTLSTTPLSTTPQVSNERLGTGVPSRLPKVDVQRPVFTIQSGGPVAMPIPQFRPIRETTSSTAPGSEQKSNLPMTEQSRAWQKPGNENTKSWDRPIPTNSQTRSTAPFTAPITVPPTAPQRDRLATQATLAPQTHLTAELPTAERKGVPTKVATPQRPLPRPTTPALPASDTPARVLNFSIN